MEKPSDNAGLWICDRIKAFVETSEENTLYLPGKERAFDVPLVGFSNGADPIYDEYVNHIGNFYLRPLDAFRKTFPQETGVNAGELTIISWILPSTRATRRAQAKENRRPCERWVKVRHYGEMFNESLRRYVVNFLSDAGISALAPILAPFWRQSDEGPYAPCSNWSERHAAYAAGLGTFGLCDGLITPLGKAIRTGSVVARIQITPDKRPYIDHHANCLFYTHGTCGKCITRCPVNAISSKGHDKQRCMQYTHRIMNAYVHRTYGISTYACGLCQAGVPCTDRIPSPEDG